MKNHEILTKTERAQGKSVQSDNPVVYSENGLSQVQASIDVVRVDLGASGALLQDQTGRLLVECGSHGDVDVNEFLALLGNSMTASGAVMPLLRDVSAFDLHVHEGANYEIYTARISDRVFLTLICARKEGASRVGMVWLTMRRLVPELRSLLKTAVDKSGAIAEKGDVGTIRSRENPGLGFSEDDPFTENPPSSRGRAKAPPKKSPAPDPAADEMVDSKRSISYEEARRLGYINLDDKESK